MEINTGVGADTLRMNGVNSGKSIKVSTDAGNDTVNATRVLAAEDAVFEGGAGVDRLFGSAQISGGVKKEIQEFEFVRQTELFQKVPDGMSSVRLVQSCQDVKKRKSLAIMTAGLQLSSGE